MSSGLDELFQMVFIDWTNSAYDRAIPALKSLAERGHVKSQRLVGIAFQNGWGVDTDIASAIQWFERAATNGDGKAALHLALIYDPSNEVSSPGIVKDASIADRYYSIAIAKLKELADQGDAEAMDSLADCYACGWGCEIDFVQAERWRTAAQSNSKNSKPA